MGADVGQPQRLRLADQLAEHAVAARRVAERAARGVVDPGREEALQPLGGRCRARRARRTGRRSARAPRRGRARAPSSSSDSARTLLPSAISVGSEPSGMARRLTPLRPGCGIRGPPHRSCGSFPMARRPSARSVAGMTTTPAIEAHDVVKVFGEGGAQVRALDGVDLVVERGEMVAIMGPSGSGKSTLLHIVGALETPTAGTVAVAGRRYDGADDAALTQLRRDHIGFVFQFFNLLGSLSAVENVLLPGADRPPHRRARSGGAPASCSTSSASSDRAVAHAGRAVRRPAAAGVDRPCAAAGAGAACSPTSRPATSTRAAAARSCALLRELSRAEGRTIVMVTHDPSAAAVADRVVFLRDGARGRRGAGRLDAARQRVLRRRSSPRRSRRPRRRRAMLRSDRRPRRPAAAQPGRCARCSPASASCSASGWCSASCCWSARSATRSTT